MVIFMVPFFLMGFFKPPLKTKMTLEKSPSFSKNLQMAGIFHSHHFFLFGDFINLTSTPASSELRLPQAPALSADKGDKGSAPTVSKAPGEVVEVQPPAPTAKTAEGLMEIWVVQSFFLGFFFRLGKQKLGRVF